MHLHIKPAQGGAFEQIERQHGPLKPKDPVGDPNHQAVGIHGAWGRTAPKGSDANLSTLRSVLCVMLRRTVIRSGCSISSQDRRERCTQSQEKYRAPDLLSASYGLGLQGLSAWSGEIYTYMAAKTS